MLTPDVCDNKESATDGDDHKVQDFKEEGTKGEREECREGGRKEEVWKKGGAGQREEGKIHNVITPPLAQPIKSETVPHQQTTKRELFPRHESVSPIAEDKCTKRREQAHGFASLLLPFFLRGDMTSVCS